MAPEGLVSQPINLPGTEKCYKFGTLRLNTAAPLVPLVRIRLTPQSLLNIDSMGKTWHIDHVSRVPKNTTPLQLLYNSSSAMSFHLGFPGTQINQSFHTWVQNSIGIFLLWAKRYHLEIDSSNSKITHAPYWAQNYALL